MKPSTTATLGTEESGHCREVETGVMDCPPKNGRYRDRRGHCGVIRGGSTEYIYNSPPRKQKLWKIMPYSGASNWLSKEPHQTSCNLAVLNWFESCCGHLPDLFLVAAVIVNSFNGCLQCQLGFLILLRSNC